jgi:hypothetical protein
MKHERINSKARVWTVTRGTDGKLREELGEQWLAALAAGKSEEEIEAAAMAELAATRVW